jgi:hypothetical protein
MAKIEKTLGIDLPALAEMLRSKGRGRDTMLAHITPKEAALLKRRGGRGSINPATGLPEFDDGFDFTPVEQAPVEQAPVEQAPAPAPAEAAPAPTSSDTGGGNFGISTGAPAQSATPNLTGAPNVGQTADYLNQAYGQFTPSTFGQLQPGITTPVGQQIADTTGPAGATGLGGTSANSQATIPQSGFFGNVVNQLTNPNTLAKLGLAGGLGLFGASQARKGAGQTQAATQQQQTIASPYQSQGQQLVSQAQAGQLTPESQQAYQAAQAQINQGIANRGGVGTQQAANQLANVYQTLLNNQYTYGLQVMQIGDNISLGAIKSGLQLDQQLNTATTNFYGQLASIVGGTGGGVPYTQPKG